MNTTGERRKIIAICENQILLKHHDSAWGLSAGSGHSYTWDLLWGSVIPDKCQLALVGFWFVFFSSHKPCAVGSRSVKSGPCPGKSRAVRSWSRSAPVPRKGRSGQEKADPCPGLSLSCVWVRSSGVRFSSSLPSHDVPPQCQREKLVNNYRLR